jgi:hypothetical protein
MTLILAKMEELEYLNQVLEELERKCIEKKNKIEKFNEEIEIIYKEKENLIKIIHEKEMEIIYEKEMEIIYEKEKQDLQMEELYHNQEIMNEKYFELFKSTSTANEDFDFKSGIKARIISIKKNGEPSEELGNNKWTRKK